MMTNEQKAELGSMVEQLSQSFQDSYDADLDLLTRRDKAHVKRIGELEADNARLVARIDELESAIVIDRGVFNRLCTLQAIMEHPTATPSAEEFDEYTGLLELVFHTHEKEAASNE